MNFSNFGKNIFYQPVKKLTFSMMMQPPSILSFLPHLMRFPVLYFNVVILVAPGFSIEQVL